MNDCDFCGEHTSDCRCDEACAACGLNCRCETPASEPSRFDDAPALDATPDDAAQIEQWLRAWGGAALRAALPK